MTADYQQQQQYNNDYYSYETHGHSGYGYGDEGRGSSKGAIEFIMTAEVCPKKTRAAAAASAMQEMATCDDKNKKTTAKSSINRSFTLDDAEMFKEVPCSGEATQKHVRQSSMMENHDNRIQENHTGEQLSTGKDNEQKEAEVIYQGRIKNSNKPHRGGYLNRTDLASQGYHSDGEISSMSPHKSPRKMTSPEKLKFKQKLFAMGDRVTRKVEKTMTKANQVRTEMREMIVSANKVQQIYEEE